MYKTNLTYVRLNNYLDELKGKELLSGDQDLFVTPKGEEFLQQVRRMKDFMEVPPPWSCIFLFILT